jgi:hypothetical protein
MLSPTDRLKSSGEWSRVSHHRRLIAQMQELRGRVYLKDEAIQAWQLQDGRHQMHADLDSWHVLVQGPSGEIRGCVHARLHHPTAEFSKFALSRSAIAQDPATRSAVAGALKSELELARTLQIPILEVGGLALDESLRGSSAILQMVFAVYGLARTLGGAIGVSTVTRRHQASCVLRKLGGQSLSHDGADIPPYFDDQYRCEMEVLKFYSWEHGLRHENRFSALQEQFSEEIPAALLNQWKSNQTHHARSGYPSVLTH